MFIWNRKKTLLGQGQGVGGWHAIFVAAFCWLASSRTASNTGSIFAVQSYYPTQLLKTIHYTLLQVPAALRPCP